MRKVWVRSFFTNTCTHDDSNYCSVDRYFNDLLHSHYNCLISFETGIGYRTNAPKSGSPRYRFFSFNFHYETGNGSNIRGCLFASRKWRNILPGGLEQCLPLRDFMLAQVRKRPFDVYGDGWARSCGRPKRDPISTLIPVFVTSELKTAFTIGFMLYIPFVIIDLIVASILMSMGMMMLSPMMISLPFKLLLFVLVAVSLITGSLWRPSLRRDKWMWD